MKILFVSMPTIHAIRWIENLKDASYELYWFDIKNRGNILIDETVGLKKNISWKKRKLKYIKGEYWLSKNAPKLYSKIQPFLEVTISEQLTMLIENINPDVVHSFEMQNCSYPIVEVMQKNPEVKWVYSCWGSDLYYYQNKKKHNKKIKEVLKRIDILHTDCERDYKIAKTLGFKGAHTGVIPGGTGYDIKKLNNLKKPIKSRNIILVKGYEHKFGRALNVLKALKLLKNELKNYQVIVFSAHKKVVDFIEENELDFNYFDKDTLNHEEVLELMGQSKIYIGNSISDGMPNTLLEAIVMNAFPIQSNPGNVTLELIENKKNGLLINNPESVVEISELIKMVLKNEIDLNLAAKINTILADTKLEFSKNKQKVVALYKKLDRKKK